MAQRLAAYAHSPALLEELDAWRRVSQVAPDALPIDHAGGKNTAGSAETVSVTLSTEQTAALLCQVPQAYQTQINDVLLTALLQAYAAWSGHRRLLLNLEGHGREELFPDVDVSRTVAGSRRSIRCCWSLPQCIRRRFR